ncbi:DUF423-domain-containing protein [Rhodotorula sp. JG-1b]|nr:DUF423-domain-containing protein [Rhodotorula sp. JG-1b]
MPIFPASATLAWKAGALLTSSGIMAGAFGAHALAPRLGDKAATWGMASQYMIFNGIGLLAISQHPVYAKRLATPLIIAGTTLFSGSIFALLLYRERMGALTKIVGPSTPVGGVLMIAGYLSLGMAIGNRVVNSIGLLAISQHPVYAKRLATPLIVAGTILFSGSIFALLL